MEDQHTDEKENRHKGKHEHPLPDELPEAAKKRNEAAQQQAGKDIKQDAELSAHNPNDDLDEEESARLGEKDNGLV